jgi:hypothetical protein
LNTWFSVSKVLSSEVVIIVCHAAGSMWSSLTIASFGRGAYSVLTVVSSLCGTSAVPVTVLISVAIIPQVWATGLLPLRLVRHREVCHRAYKWMNVLHGQNVLPSS